MGWELVGTPKTVKVTQKVAQEFAEMEPVPHDRPLSERRLEVYKKLFDQGKFRPCTWSKVYCKETNCTYRVNGKHTSTLLSLYAKPPDYYVTIESYVCETLADAARLYNTFDSKIQSRNVNDINLSFASTIPELAGCSGRTISLVVGGYWCYADVGRRACSLPPAERAEVLLSEKDFVLWADTIFSEAERERSESKLNAKHLRRQPVVGAMWASWKRASEDASTFWREVRDETGKSPEVPTRKLARYLTQSTMRSINSASRYTVTHKELMVKCIHAWNAWRRKASTNLRYEHDAPVPDLV